MSSCLMTCGTLCLSVCLISSIYYYNTSCLVLLYIILTHIITFLPCMQRRVPVWGTHAMNFAHHPVPVNLHKVSLKSKLKSFQATCLCRPSLQLCEATSLIVLQFRNVFVEVQWVRIGECSSLCHLPTSNHLFYSYLHLLTADGIL